jgi:hypothetical protein
MPTAMLWGNTYANCRTAVKVGPGAWVQSVGDRIINCDTGVDNEGRFQSSDLVIE